MVFIYRYYVNYDDCGHLKIFLIAATADVVGVVLLSRSCFPLKKVLSKL